MLNVCCRFISQQLSSRCVTWEPLMYRMSALPRWYRSWGLCTPTFAFCAFLHRHYHLPRDNTSSCSARELLRRQCVGRWHSDTVCALVLLASFARVNLNKRWQMNWSYLHVGLYQKCTLHNETHLTKVYFKQIPLPFAYGSFPERTLWFCTI